MREVKKKLFNNKTLSLTIILLFAGSMVSFSLNYYVMFASGPYADAIEYIDQAEVPIGSKESWTIAKATQIIGKSNNLEFAGFQEILDDSDGSLTFEVKWTTEKHDLVEVVFDSTSLKVKSLFDGRKYSDVTRNHQRIDEERAIKSAIYHLESLQHQNLIDLPLDLAQPQYHMDDDTCSVRWDHFINEMKVIDDHLSVTLNAYTGEVVGIVIKWSDVIQ